jgi:putative ABC transport system substrate-binding protein
MANGLRFCARHFRQFRNLAVSRFIFNGMDQLSVRRSVKPLKPRTSLSPHRYSNLTPTKQAIQNLSRDGANAVMVVDSPSVFHNSTLIANLLGEAKFKAMCTLVASVTAGGLTAYTLDLAALN